MLPLEKERIEFFRRRIEKYENEIIELELDFKKVKNERVQDFIDKEIDIRKNAIDQAEFEIWKTLKYSNK